MFVYLSKIREFYNIYMTIYKYKHVIITSLDTRQWEFSMVGKNCSSTTIFNNNYKFVTTTNKRDKKIYQLTRKT